MEWSKEQSAAAKAEGWALREVVDNGTSHVHLRAFSLIDGRHEAATARLIGQARVGSRLHVEALRLIAASRFTAPFKKPTGKTR